jgi:chromatin assembly factor 1 subunit B
MDLHHRRGGSNSGHFVWDNNAKPPMKRSASSHASHASDSEREGATPKNNSGTVRQRTGRSSTPLDIAAASGIAPPTANSSSSSTSNFAPAAAATPTLSYNAGGRAGTPSPAPTSMNPPQRTPSRRSSFSGSQVEALSPPTTGTSFAPTSHPASVVAGVSAAGGGSTPIKTSNMAELTASSGTSRSASRTRGLTPRSPSPAPPLPAIRAPPSPKQRMAAAASMHPQISSSGGGSLAKAGMRLYGDENFSGFFRRLTFSPDGALLVTPTGIFENAATAALNQMHLPASPTTTTHPLSRHSEQEEFRNSPGSPMPLPHPLHHSPAVNHPSTSIPPRSTVYLYGRGNLHKSNAPIAHLPGHKTASLVIKFSPILYELRKGTRWNKAEDMNGIAPHPTVPLEVGKHKTVSLSFAANSVGGVASSSAIQDDALAGSGNGVEARPKSTRSSSSTSSAHSSPRKQQQQQPSSTPPISATTNSMIGLPYRMIFAVATHDSVWIYDTQQGGPLCCFSNMHYASFTDLTWSSDGQTLMMCSTDGYCSVVVFDYEELGTPYHYHSQPSLQVSSAAPTYTTLLARRESNQGVPVSGQDQEKPHHQSLLAVAHDGSPTLGLGLATGLVEVEAASPLIIQEQQSREASTQEKDSDTNARKKRRIAPTLQGPVGS